jgi:DNA gyrase inhibitor GyrI
MADLDVRIVTLSPLRVASFHGFGTGPEEIALAKLQGWAEPRGFLDAPQEHRIFGFNNPDPSPGSANYGYEFWIVVGPDVQSDDEATVKEFGGGLYAVTRCDVKNPWQDIPGTWTKLVAWCENSPYRMAHHQWLEEHIVLSTTRPALEFVLDLHLPIVA